MVENSTFEKPPLLAVFFNHGGDNPVRSGDKLLQGGDNLSYSGDNNHGDGDNKFLHPLIKILSKYKSYVHSYNFSEGVKTVTSGASSRSSFSSTIGFFDQIVARIGPEMLCQIAPQTLGSAASGLK